MRSNGHCAAHVRGLLCRVVPIVRNVDRGDKLTLIDRESSTRRVWAMVAQRS
jgi:hypothetical protein